VKGLNRYRVAYLILVAVLAYSVKRWYSQATLLEMQWIMQPLAIILEQIIPGDFERNSKGEWFHAGWQILLVKECSGVNFLIMSFIGYALIFERKMNSTASVNIIHQISCCLFAFSAAWISTLVINVARILLAMSFIRYPSLIQWTGLDHESIHRIAGLMVYFPALYVQIKIGQEFNRKSAYIICSVLMVSILVIVPLLTGNALNHSEAFVRHTLSIMVFISLFGFLISTFNKWPINIVKK